MATPQPTSFGDGRYVVERPLGVGGMGSVWLARDRRFADRLVAVKLVEADTQDARAGRFLQRFRREARLLANLRHPNLVGVFDVDFAAEPPYLVMEYVEGEDLALRLARRGPLDEPAVRRLLREQAGALACLHEQGVVHRDLKPGNVLLDSDGGSRLTDLGLAFDADSTKLTRDDSILGTWAYMAPEILRGEDASPRSDVFALGLVVHEAATLVSPLPTDDCQAYVTAVLSGTLEPPALDPSLPPDLAAVIGSCLQLDPAARPADGAAVLALLGGPSGPAAADTAPAPTAPIPSAPAPASRRLATVLLVLAAVLPLVLFRLHLSSSSPRVPSSAPPPLGTAAPLVLRGLDLTELVLPSEGPLPVTLRLETTSGELLVQRTIHDGRLLFRLPRPEPDGDLRWSARLGDTTFRGLTHGGLRPEFVPAEGPAGPAPVRDMAVQPWVVAAGHLVLPSAPGTLTLLRPDRSPQASSRLAVDQALYLTPPPEQEGLSHPVAGMGPLGSDRLVLVGRGQPSGLTVLGRAPSGNLEPGTAAVWPHERVLGALTAPCPGGGLAVLLRSRPVTDGTAGRPRILVGTLSPADPPVLSALALPGTVPLALGALDDDTLALAYGDGDAPVTLMLVTRSDDTFRPLATATLAMHAPGWWGPHLGLPLALLPSRGRAVFGGRNGLVVLESTGSVRSIPLGLDDTAVVGAVVHRSDDLVLAVAVAPAVPGISRPVSVYAALVDTAPGAPPPEPPTFLVSLEDNLSGALPLACVPIGNGIHLFLGNALLELDGRPPFTLRRRRPMPGALPAGAAVVEGMVCLLDRRGRVFAYDPVDED